MTVSKKLIARIFPKYSLILDQLNNNAKLAQWIKANSNLPKFDGRLALYEFVNERFIASQSIDFFEFGVFEGASLKAWAELHKNPKSRFFGFDSFEGLPEDWGSNLKASAFSLGGRIPLLEDPRIRLVKGWFQDSVPGFFATLLPESRVVIHIDSDLHSSALYVLTRMNEYIKPGTILIFDEFASALHEFRALDDYCRSYRRNVVPLAMTKDFAAQAAFMVS